MTALDLHPEDLLERDARGELSADERARLEAHLDACQVCRFEQRVRADLRAEAEDDPPVDVRRLVAAALMPESLQQLETPVRPARADGADAVVASRSAAPRADGAGHGVAPGADGARSALAARSTRDGADGAGHILALRWVRAPRTRPAALFAVALLTVAGVSTAAVLSGLRPSIGRHVRVVESVGVAAPSPAVPTAGHPGARRLATSPAAEGSPSAPDGVTPEPGALAEANVGQAPGPVSMARATSALAPRSEPSPLAAPSPRAGAGARAHAWTSPALEPALAPLDPALDAASLFAAATRARRSGDRPGAVAGYAALLRAYPDTPEGRQALVALGKMRLDGGDAAGALRCFDEYLRVGGPLREDVMADRAVALQRMGRAVDETAAWSALLAAYPASVHAERARRRMAELGAP